MNDEDKKTFWLDGFEGKAKGGHYIRNNLNLFFEKLESNGTKPVAIVYNGSMKFVWKYVVE